MKIFEVLKFVAAIDQAIVNEGFKELAAKDKFKGASEKEKNEAREVYQELIKNASIKDEFIKGKTGNIDQMIEKTYNSLSEFIKGINDIKTAVEKRAKQKKQAKDATFRQKAIDNAGKNISEDTTKYAQYRDGTWYIIPCHTYEEVRDAAKALTGNLPTGFADSYIEGKWVIEKASGSVIEAEPNGIDINNLDTSRYEKIKKPASAHMAKTSLSPTLYFNVYKTAPFFMQPSWCIAGSENGRNFFESYNLETEKDENARCYVIISDAYPNVRFCITYEAVEQTTIQGDEPNGIIDDDYLQNTRVLHNTVDYDLSEVRDPWQTGSARDVGLEMIESIPGLYDKIEDLLNNRNAVKSCTLAELKKSSGRLFGEFKNVIEVTANFSNLVYAFNMFGGNKNLKEFNGKLPKLKDGSFMFEGAGLTLWNTPLPNLKYGESMFSYTKLTSWDTPLPNLINGGDMFEGTELTSWDVPLPNLENGNYMFAGTPLTSWNTPLPNLKYAAFMFLDVNLTSWDVPLPNLVQAMNMFRGCKLDKESVYNILNSIPFYSDNESHKIGIGVGYSINQEEIDHLVEKFTEKGWTLELTVD